MNQNMKKHIYKNRILIIFMIVVLSILLYSFFYDSNSKVDSNTESLFEESNKSLNTKLEEEDNDKLTDNQFLNKDNDEKKLKPEIKNNKKISKEKDFAENIKPKIKKNTVSKALTKEVININNPNETISLLHSGLKKISQKKSFDRNEIVGLISKTFNIEKMVSIIIGNKWGTLETSAKNELISVFEEYVSKNYFKRFSKINKPKFVIDEQKKVSKFILVKTILIIKKTEQVRIDYLLSNEKSGWKIFDVLIDGAISEIATKKSEFSVYIKNDNIDSLINALRKINTQLIKN